MIPEFDVVVIGGGPGGYAAAARVSQLGFKTALVEKERLGGVCVNWGCIPTKALLRNAEIMYTLSLGKTFGFQCDNIATSYASARSRSRQVASRQHKRVELLLKKRHVTLFQGEARLVNETTVEISPSGDRILGKNIILATGSKPKLLPGINANSKKTITYREALQMDNPPARAIIIGAGPIGMEFATIWNRYGSEVVVLEMMPRILPAEDADISIEALANFKRRGVKVKTGVKVDNIVETPAGVEVLVSNQNGREKIDGEIALIATGFSPNTTGLGLEQLGIAMDGGYIEIDHHMRTNFPNIFAIGDITGKLALAHTATAQGYIAASAIAGRHVDKLAYENIPRCVFGEVEVASVGLTEKQAQDRGYDVVTAISPFAPNGKAVALNENQGFVKIVADKRSKRLLGVHIVGSHASELIAGPASMIALGATVEQVAKAIYPHPTLSETFIEGVQMLTGQAIHF